MIVQFCVEFHLIATCQLWTWFDEVDHPRSLRSHYNNLCMVSSLVWGPMLLQLKSNFCCKLYPLNWKISTGDRFTCRQCNVYFCYMSSLHCVRTQCRYTIVIVCNSVDSGTSQNDSAAWIPANIFPIVLSGFITEGRGDQLFPCTYTSVHVHTFVCARLLLSPEPKPTSC